MITGGDQPLYLSVIIVGTVALQLELGLVAQVVELEGILVFTAHLQPFTQSETEMEAVFKCIGLDQHLSPHHSEVIIFKAKRLQVGQAPPGVAKAGLELRRLAIRGNGFILVADRLEGVAVG